MIIGENELSKIKLEKNNTRKDKNPVIKMEGLGQAGMTKTGSVA